jgi:hypothetical protein
MKFLQVRFLQKNHWKIFYLMGVHHQNIFYQNKTWNSKIITGARTINVLRYEKFISSSEKVKMGKLFVLVV